MKRSLLVSFISTLAFSIGLVKAGATLNVKRGLQAPILPTYDAMGVTSNHIKCGNAVFNKREAYAAVAQAMKYEGKDKFAVAGCESVNFCTRYPKYFSDPTIKFKMNRLLRAFPIDPKGKLYEGGILPVSNLVIYDEAGEVAGIVQATLGRYVKCLVDDNYVPRQGIKDRIIYKYNYYTGRN